MTSIAINDMLERGLMQRVDASNLDTFLQAQGLQVLFFAGCNSQRSDAHDVAVALREVLKDYGGAVRAGLVAEENEADLQPRFRILALPSLALVLDGETLEVIPRVRDWSDYVRAFRRYLGAPAATDTATEPGS
jgi:hydrogenase-1 operon protein HyaE